MSCVSPVSRLPHRRSKRPLALVVFAAAGLAACDDNTALIEPLDLPAANRVEATGSNTPNSPVHFLPPIAAAPTSTGVFDSALSPEVVIYEGTAAPCPEGAAEAGCARELIRFTMGGEGPGVIRVDPENEYFIVNWNVGGRADRSAVYRIAVRLDGALLDYVFVSGVRGTLPIRFRIDEVAADVGTAPVGEEGGAVSTPSGSASVEIPEGSLDQELFISVTPEALDPATDERVIAGSKHFFGPTGTTFAQPVTITLRYDVSLLPAGVAPGLLRLHRFENGAWRLIPGSSSDAAEGTVSGEVTSFSLYAALPVAFTSVVTGAAHACGLTAEGAAWCWGSNKGGQLGVSAPDICDGQPCALSPKEVDGGHEFVSLAAGIDHTCGVTTGGSALCWGSNARGELGNGSGSDSSFPTPVSGLSGITALASGGFHSCAVANGGAAYCWGSNGQGRTGVPSTESVTCGDLGACTPTPVQVPGLSGITSVTTGILTSCALSGAGTAWCWGGNAFSQITDAAPLGAANVPPTVIPGGPWSSISAGAIHVCTVDAGGAASCWGGGQFQPFGTLGTGVLENSATPMAVAGGHTFSEVRVSPGNNVQSFACGLTTAGTALCWGANPWGQLGVESAPELCAEGNTFLETQCSSAPLAVSGGLVFADLSTNNNFACALTSDGDPYCWGRNVRGELGDGTLLARAQPERVIFTP